MGIRAVITGSTGMVGKGVLLECLDSAEVDRVLIVSRKSLRMTHPKLHELLLADFRQIDQVRNDLRGYNTCFFCLGVSSFRMSEPDYAAITYDLTLDFARVFLEANPESTFCYVSGTGTDSSEQGRTMWARVKGRTENALLQMGFQHAYMFRPGYIQPLRGIRSKTKLYDNLYLIFKPLYAILKHFPGSATNTSVLGQAMIRAVEMPYAGRILGNREINKLGA